MVRDTIGMVGFLFVRFENCQQTEITWDGTVAPADEMCFPSNWILSIQRRLMDGCRDGPDSWKSWGVLRAAAESIDSPGERWRKRISMSLNNRPISSPVSDFLWPVQAWQVTWVRHVRLSLLTWAHHLLPCLQERQVWSIDCCNPSGYTCTGSALVLPRVDGHKYLADKAGLMQESGSDVWEPVDRGRVVSPSP